MAMKDAVILAMTDDSRIAEARRFVKTLAYELHFTDSDIERAAIVVTEAASNIMKHAQHGRVIIRAVSSNTLEILALDDGPGIANVARAMEDGYSTANSKGIGLGAIARLSSSFHIYSVSGVGTALMIRLWANKKSDKPKTLDVEVISSPKPPEKLNGDAWSVAYYMQKVFFLVADGLGHGPEAAEASQKAVETFDSVSARSPAEYIEAIHINLKGTRGAAVAVTEVDLVEQQIRFAGVGNINTVLVSSSKSQTMLSQPGIVGQQIRSLQEFVYTWKEMANPLLIMHTDGMEKRWDLDDYPGLAPMPLSLIAGVLLTKHMRGYDDIAVLVSRLRQP
jgi:anti-sigma regulatory factor (Ser/Thr protein kinase)